MTYLLDTNAVSGLLRRSLPITMQARAHAGQLCISSIVLAELWTSFLRADRPDRFIRRWEDSGLEVLPFEPRDAICAGEVRAALMERGAVIGGLDILIAGHALCRDLILVTHNTREFARVPGLALEDWEA